MATLIDHLERFCGPILHGWANDPDGRKMPFQIVQMESGPYQAPRPSAPLASAIIGSNRPCPISLFDMSC
jgi:hypothetical protein